jgi:hypothetical protein
MQSRIACVVTSFVFVTGLARTASAQGVSEYGLFKIQGYQQTTNALPAMPDTFYCSLRVDTLTQSSITGGSVTWSGPDSPATLTFLSTGSANGVPIWEYWWPSPSFTAKSDLDTNCPAGSYSFSISGGTLGAETAPFTGTADAYSTSVPAVDAPSFAAVQAYNPSTVVTLSTVTHAQAAGTQFSATWLDLDDVVANTTVASSYGADGGVLSLQIPAGTLTPAHDYEVSVYFSDRVLVANAGFSTTSEAAFDLNTVVPFETLLADGGIPPGDGGTAPEAGPVEAGMPEASAGTDASTGPTADAATEDATAPEDSGSFTVPDSGGSVSPSSNTGSKAGCGCRLGGAPASDGLGALAGVVFACGLARRRRRRTGASCTRIGRSSFRLSFPGS